jgi:outer membrane receptor for ferrienterochelin and colicins
MSVLYGSEALGGVINIVTKQPEELVVEINPQVRSYLEGGLQKSASLFVSSPPLGKFAVSGSVSYIDRDPYESGESQILYDGRFLNASLKTVYSMSDEDSIVFDAAYLNELVNPDAINEMTGTVRKTTWDDSRYDASLQFSHAGTAVDYRIRGYFSYYDKIYQVEDLVTDQTTNFITAERYFPVFEGQLSGGFYAAGDHLFTAGLEYRPDTYRGTKIKTGEDFEFEEEVDGKTYGGSTKTIHYVGLYAQDEWNPFPKLLLVGSLRYDQAFEVAGSLSPKLGLTYSILPGLRAKAVYGRGFRTPDVEELYYDFTAYMGPVIGVHNVLGNTDLKPETSNSYELAVEGETKRLSGRAAWYYNKVDNLIEAVKIGGTGTVVDPTTSQYQNIKEARFQGVELETTYTILESLSLSASYAFLGALDVTNDERLEERPKHKLLTKLAFDSKRLGLRSNLYVTYVGSSIENGKDKSWTTLDMSVLKTFAENYTVYLGGDNLLNRKDEDIPLLGLNLYGGFRLRF